MILTCPECAAKYLVATDTIGEIGRDVRCAKCGHTWHQKSERDSLDDLINRIQSEELDEIEFGERGKARRGRESLPGKSIKDKLAGIIAKIDMVFSRFKSGFKINFKLKLPRETGKILKSAGASAALFLICTGAAILARGPLTHAFPAISPVFAALGMEMHEEAPVANIEDVLAIDHLALDQEEHGSTFLTGALINLTSSEVNVPPVRVEIIGEGRKIVWSEKLELASKPLPAEDQLDFRIKLEKIPSEGGQRLELRFDLEKELHSPAEEG